MVTSTRSDSDLERSILLSSFLGNLYSTRARVYMALYTHGSVSHRLGGRSLRPAGTPNRKNGHLPGGIKAYDPPLFQRFDRRGLGFGNHKHFRLLAGSSVYCCKKTLT